MDSNLIAGRRIAVIGLGYVGLPVAVAFAKFNHVIAFDINKNRIKELTNGFDATLEISSQEFDSLNINFTCDASDLAHADFFIIAVPTPIDSAKQPDLTPIIRASETVARILKVGDIVVYESTVYPGATEEECVPILESLSGLTYKQDFTVGYSPERINPGDKEHSFTNITKVVSATDEKSLAVVAKVYETVVTAGVHKTSSIAVAEAAKVIENTQRDLNIALMNELSLIFNKMGIDTNEVLAAAGTKWNFLPFKPGLVGGHCIGVDPYYLTYRAKQFGYRPEVILAGRRINDSMGKYIAEQCVKKMIHAGVNIKDAGVGILGLTFKENCKDIRNSKVVDIINELKSYDVNVLVHDDYADREIAKREYEVDVIEFSDITNISALIIAVAHDDYKKLSPKDLSKKFSANSNIIIDVKGSLDSMEFKKCGFTIWCL